MEEPIISVKDLCFSYGGGRPALDSVNVSIKAGEKIAILGSNGAGKSTFFLTINGVLTPDRGEITLLGQKINKKNLNELRRHVGVVFQDADSQIIASSVRAEISFGPMNLKLPREEVAERVNEAMDYMDLAQFADRPPHYLSGGEKKRVSIADIIAMKSEVFLFDEPTASLDPVNAAMLGVVLDRLSAEKKTLLISTHDMDFAYRWAQRVLVFCNGAMIAEGSPLEIFKNDNILAQANLHKPMLLEVCEALERGGALPGAGAYPRSVEEFKQLF